MDKLLKVHEAKAKVIEPGGRISLAKNIIKSNKNLVFSADIESLGGGGKLLLGHGYMEYFASWVEIGEDYIEAFSYYSYRDPAKVDLLGGKQAHGLKITDFISASITYELAENLATVKLMTASGDYEIKVEGWCGSDGEVFASFEGARAENCKLCWASPDFVRPIWLIGDSYTGVSTADRWPYYMRRDGYLNLLMMGYPGMNAQRGIKEFMLTVGEYKPEVAVWALGMNNGDKDDKINPDYLCATLEFIKVCKEKGIVPILTTTPNTPKVDNRYKNEWVRSSGYRYIDFARAVGSDKVLGWYPDMLSPDLVHPDVKGAKALYMQLLVDLPEIMDK